MVDFAGYSMPVQYESIVSEHRATREAVGLFDISHMGRLRFDGPRAGAFLDSLLTRSVALLDVGAVAYSLVTNQQGGILDDVLVYRLRDAAGGDYYLLVVNASNRAKIVDWIQAHRNHVHGTTASDDIASDDTATDSAAFGDAASDEGVSSEGKRSAASAASGAWADVLFSDVSQSWAMIAVQGPRALDIAQPLVEADVAALSYYHGCETMIAGHGGIVSRTGYTGEDGLELIVGAAVAPQVWQQLYDAAEPLGGRACGLGCRDTLRLEAGMPLYGHELNERITPWQAGLGFAVDLAGRDFPGHDALAQSKVDPQRPRRVGLELEGRRAAREHYDVMQDGQSVGQVTSGTFSPTFEKPIAMAYVSPRAAAVGTELSVDIRGRAHRAKVVKLPFYRRGKSNGS
jgi:aminomethyltransferase